MYLVQSPLLFRKANRFGPVWQMPKDSKTIYLTFDDGPVPEVTFEVLAILDKYNIKATFFCVGDNIDKNPDVFKTIIEKGHTTGNHTFNHLSGWKTHSNKYIENILKCDHYHKTNLFRPPYGRIKPSQLLKLKKTHKIIMWSVLSGDFNQKTSPEKCFENVVRYTKPGSIVVFHDSIKAQKNVLYALPLFINYFLEQGYTFKPL